MPKKELEMHAKDLQKLKESVEKLDQKFSDQIATLNQVLRDRVEEFDQELKNLTENIDNQINSNSNRLKKLNDDFSLFQEKIDQQINTQKEINIELIQEFEKQFTKDKRLLEEQLEKIKAEQDVLKISYTVNEKQLLDKIQATIASEIKNVCSDKEREILMNVWIKELKDIIIDFEKLKKMHPKEFSLKIEEISDTIEIFKQKILK